MHDREITLWNARMGIYFDANVYCWDSQMTGGNRARQKTQPDARWCAYVMCKHFALMWFCIVQLIAQEYTFGMPQPAAALSITNSMNPHLFFFCFFHVFSSRFPCLVVSLSACPHMSAKELFSMFVSVDLCWSATKHMTGKSLCEMRGCVYISTQMFCYLSLCITPLWTATSSEHREWSGLFLG